MYSVRQDKTICERITNADDRTGPNMKLKQYQVDAFSSRVFEGRSGAEKLDTPLSGKSATSEFRGQFMVI